MKHIYFVKDNNDFKLIFEKGHSIYGKYLVVYFLRNQLDHNRFGICAGKKLGTAVERNRVKRLLREAIRSIVSGSKGEQSPLTGWDILLVARSQIKEINLAKIIEEIRYLLCKIRKIS